MLQNAVIIFNNFKCPLPSSKYSYTEVLICPKPLSESGEYCTSGF